MKKLSQQIYVPLLCSMLAISVIMLLIVNFSVAVYSCRMIETGLQATLKNVNIMIRQLSSLASRVEDAQIDLEDPFIDNFSILRKAYKVSTSAENTEMLILRADGELLYPATLSETAFVTLPLLRAAQNALTDAPSRETRRLLYGGHIYFLVYRSAESNNGPVRLLLLSTDLMVYDILRVFNAVSLAVTLAVMGVGVFVARGISEKITRPIRRLSESAQHIEEGALFAIPQDTSSAEAFALTNTINDISARLNAQMQAQKAFLHNASHELRTPLMSIQGYAEGLERGIFTDVKRTASIVASESHRLNRLVEQLLSLSRIENRVDESTAAEDVSAIVSDCLDGMTGLCLSRQKTFRVDLPGEACVAQANADLLAQAVNNVLANAIEYAQSTVTLSLTPRSDTVLLRVSDDGPGIEDTLLPFVFERFRKGKNGHTGLGLSIAKTAVEAMGGSIRAYNENGAVMEITLARRRGGENAPCAQSK